MRPDISEAIEGAPSEIQRDLELLDDSLLALLDRHLPLKEEVIAVSSAAAEAIPTLAATWLLMLTDRRLLLIRPTPHVTTWRLHEIDEVLVEAHPDRKSALIIKSGDRAVSTYVDRVWMAEFERLLRTAVAQTRIQQRN